MSRSAAIDRASRHLDSGALLADLRRRVAVRTVSSDPRSGRAHHDYLTREIAPQLARLGCAVRIVDNPVEGAAPFLLAHRHEDDRLPTVLTYGHGDVVDTDEADWGAGLRPWRVVVRGERWYGRGTADNKGQHTINLAALEQVLAARGGRLGFNLTVLFDMAEEIGSPGLDEICAGLGDELSADVLIASDGMRVAAGRPTIFLGSRGELDFTLRVRLRDEPYHSGNWGGLLRNPATVLAHAIAVLVDDRGRVLPAGLRPPPLPGSVRRALAGIRVDGGPGSPPIDLDWGEPDLTPAERVYGWNTLEVLAIGAGSPGAPTNAIPGHAVAHCQLRFVVGTDWSAAGTVLREHLDRHGLTMVEVDVGAGVAATRVDPDNAWVRWTESSLRETTGADPALLPNLGGTLPNAAFADTLGIPTIWVPHSYPACAQHAPDEHLLTPLAHEALRIMAGLFWDLGDLGAHGDAWRERLERRWGPADPAVSPAAWSSRGEAPR
ncbi:M20 family metallopeptidase [Jiangella alba]|uniref:Acetylornithine deacetylase/Succinyl-diaminopimelate desuccinylase n=1 Tax=Jiangella alba TaxID=561176 RepID=A0A1H5L6D2_9ACTN|nr:M20 family metallopeptidase [Jiangella alba]SEE72616.1 Acetylornithine deacetylase/Succinyl-diaminopimelate desuccinylase [Jiangella alba]